MLNGFETSGNLGVGSIFHMDGIFGGWRTSVFPSYVLKLLLGAFTFRIVFVFLMYSIKFEIKEAGKMMRQK